MPDAGKKRILVVDDEAPIRNLLVKILSKVKEPENYSALFVLPVIALGGYSAISFGAMYLVVRWTKAMENATDYSLMNTTRHALFLITSREAQYKAKAAIDSPAFWAVA